MLLSYLCNRAFDKASAELKEYTIGIEAMGLPANFDQAEGSTVRVAIHRLRKRLRSYYDGEGSSSEIEIRLLPGEYAPDFFYRFKSEGSTQSGTAPAPVSPKPSFTASGHVDSLASGESGLPEEQEHLRSAPWPELIQQLPGPEQTVGARGQRKPSVVAGLVMLGIVATAAILVLFTYSLRKTPVSPPHLEHSRPSAPPLPDAHGAPVRLLAGSKVSEYTDPSGNLWSGDRYYSGGEAFDLLASKGSKPPIVARESDQELVRHYREGSDFSYEIPVEPGRYELSLGFVETEFGPEQPGGGGENSRTFDIKINGETVVDHFDIYAEAGGANSLNERRFGGIVPSANGKVHLQFSSSRNTAILSFIQLVPQRSAQMNPLHVATLPHAFIDNVGRQWIADNYYLGGQRVLSNADPSGTSVPELYQSQRFGSFSYSLPVIPGRSYKVTLHFSESYFGTSDESNANRGIGARLFDIGCNGTLLVHDFDILAEAGGPNRAISRTFQGLRASPQGKLLITFQPSKNYALVNAIEVAEEAP